MLIIRRLRAGFTILSLRFASRQGFVPSKRVCRKCKGRSSLLEGDPCTFGAGFPIGTEALDRDVKQGCRRQAKGSRANEMSEQFRAIASKLIILVSPFIVVVALLFVSIELLFSLYLYISGTNTTNRVSIALRVITYAAGGVIAIEVKIPCF